MVEADVTRYMSPELINGIGTNVKLTPKSDIWSFSMIIIEVITGWRAWYDLPLDAAVYRAIMDGARPKRPDRSVMDNSIVDTLWALCERCWAADPTQRPEIHEAHNRLARLSTRTSQSDARSEDDVVCTLVFERHIYSNSGFRR